jgi:hypothetical protein
METGDVIGWPVRRGREWHGYPRIKASSKVRYTTKVSINTLSPNTNKRQNQNQNPSENRAMPYQVQNPYTLPNQQNPHPLQPV